MRESTWKSLRLLGLKLLALVSRHGQPQQILLCPCRGVFLRRLVLPPMAAPRRASHPPSASQSELPRTRGCRVCRRQRLVRSASSKQALRIFSEASERANWLNGLHVRLIATETPSKSGERKKFLNLAGPILTPKRLGMAGKSGQPQPGKALLDPWPGQNCCQDLWEQI